MSTFLVLFVISQTWSTPIDLGIAGIDDIYPQVCHKQQMYTDTLCLVWQAFQGSDWEIYSRFSNGISWSDTIRITDNSPDDTRPRVTYDINNNRFWCVWVRNDNIFAAYSTGMTWSAAEQITTGAPIDNLPSIHCISGEMWVVWQRIVGDSVNIYSSYRSGTSWSAAIPVTSEANVENSTPRVAESQTRVLAVWERGNDIYYSTYVSSSWQTPQPITSSAATDSAPEIASSDFGGTAVCWQTDEHGDWEVYRTETGNFGVHHRVTNDVATDVIPCPLFYTIPVRQWDIPAIAFTSDRTGNDDVYCWDEYQGSVAIDNDPAQDLYPVLTANLRVYVWALWQTDRDGDWDICGNYQYIQGSVEENCTGNVILCTISPNPFRSSTMIKLLTPNTKFQVKIYDASGRLIRNLSHSTPDVLRSSLYWDGTDLHGHAIAPGIYFVAINNSIVQKVVKIEW